MGEFKKILLILAVWLGCVHAPACSPDVDKADTIYSGGPIVTVNDSQPNADAVAVKDGKIVAVGSESDVMEWRGDDTRVVDLDGKTMVPGFVDGHAHFSGFGAQAVGAKLLAPPDGQVETIDDLVAALKQFAEGPDVERTGWIFGLGYDDVVEVVNSKKAQSAVPDLSDLCRTA